MARPATTISHESRFSSKTVSANITEIFNPQCIRNILLDLASILGNLEVVEMFIRYGAELKYVKSVLSCSVIAGNWAIAKELLRAGAPVAGHSGKRTCRFPRDTGSVEGVDVSVAGAI